MFRFSNFHFAFSIVQILNFYIFFRFDPYIVRTFQTLSIPIQEFSLVKKI